MPIHETSDEEPLYACGSCYTWFMLSDLLAYCFRSFAWKLKMLFELRFRCFTWIWRCFVSDLGLFPPHIDTDPWCLFVELIMALNMRDMRWIYHYFVFLCAACGWVGFEIRLLDMSCLNKLGSKLLFGCWTSTWPEWQQYGTNPVFALYLFLITLGGWWPADSMISWNLWGIKASIRTYGEYHAGLKSGSKNLPQGNDLWWHMLVLCWEL